MADTAGGNSETVETTQTDIQKEGEQSNTENEGDSGDTGADDNKVLDDKDFEPQVRKSNADWVAERRQRKIEKLQNKGSQQDGAGDDTGSDEEGDEDGDGKSGDVQSIVEDTVRRILQPVQNSIRSQETTTAISSFLSDPNNANFKRYEKVAVKAADVWANLPIELVFKALDYDAAIARAIKGNTEATANVKKGRITGTTIRKGGSITPDFSKMTPQEFEAYNNKIMSGHSEQT